MTVEPDIDNDHECTCWPIKSNLRSSMHKPTCPLFRYRSGQERRG